jgi:hypothetical protein
MWFGPMEKPAIRLKDCAFDMPRAEPARDLYASDYLLNIGPANLSALSAIHLFAEKTCRR